MAGTRSTFVGLLLAVLCIVNVQACDRDHLPIFFFHGITANNLSAGNFVANLTAEGRTIVPLSFCENACSVTDLNNQVTLAIKQIRGIVANDTRFQHGYMFIGHSQGAAIARMVVEEMDDHNVIALLSLAGAQNGLFYGPQQADLIPSLVLKNSFGPAILPASYFNFSNYTTTDIVSGKMSFDLNDFWFTQPTLPLSFIQLSRPPVEAKWIPAGNFLPVYNNLQKCASLECVYNLVRRRANFLRLGVLHAFASPADEVLAPWQTAIFGRYSTVSSSEELRSSFSSLKVVDMNATTEYVKNTYGLRSLDVTGRLVQHVVPDVPHTCWLRDTPSLATNTMCNFKDVYDKYVYPVLQKL